ncbi:MAG: hypothetical protein M4579_001831 [Chaenotheca gracillima]|nr:MAG: hypothetical protein M4579_001831 [Chaenotheca gracillima]
MVEEQQPKPLLAGRVSTSKQDRVPSRGNSKDQLAHDVSGHLRQARKAGNKLMAMVYVDKNDNLLITKSTSSGRYVAPDVERRFNNVVDFAQAAGRQSSGLHSPGKMSRASSTAAGDEDFKELFQYGRKRTVRVPSSVNNSDRQKKRRQIKPYKIEPISTIKQEPVDDDDAFDQGPGEASPLQGRTIRLGDERALEQYYYDRFEQVQQKDCKTITKAWIKTIHPKKQSTHPYVRGFDSAPNWWPEEAYCEHTEPDHLIKEQRIYLMKHILSLDNQVAPLAKLEKATSRLEHKIKKHALLKEVYRVAKKAREAREGILGGNTLVYVAASPKYLLKGQDIQGGSDDDDDGAGESDSDHETEPISPTSTSQGTSRIIAPIAQISLGEAADLPTPAPKIEPMSLNQDNYLATRPQTAHPDIPSSNDSTIFPPHYDPGHMPSQLASITSPLDYTQGGSFSSDISMDYVPSPQTMFPEPGAFLADTQTGSFGHGDDIFARHASRQRLQQPGYHMLGEEHNQNFHMTSPHGPVLGRSMQSFDHVDQGMAADMMTYPAQDQSAPYSDYLSAHPSGGGGGGGGGDFLTQSQNYDHLEDVKLQGPDDQ